MSFCELIVEVLVIIFKWCQNVQSLFLYKFHLTNSGKVNKNPQAFP